MTNSPSYEALGLSFTVCAPDDVDPLVRRLLRPLASEHARPAHRYEITHRPDLEPNPYGLRFDDRLLVAAGTLDTAFEHLTWHFTDQAAASAPGFALHAGAVAGRRGALVLPGRSGSGKSTLTAALLCRGYSYLTDELAVLPGTSRTVMPFTRAVGLSRASWAALCELSPGWTDLVAIDAGKLHVDVTPVCTLERAARPVVAVVFPRFESGATLTAEPMRAAESVAEAARNSFNAVTQGRSGLEVLADLVDGVQTGRLTFGTLADAVDHLASLLGPP